jgi:hypothetical protein
MNHFKALLLATAFAGCGSSSPAGRAGLSDADSARLLVDRNWIDRLPAKVNDHLHVYRFVPSMGGGVFQDRTLFKGEFELFVFEVKAGRIEFFMPHEHKKFSSGFRIERTSEGPEGYDLRLTLEAPPRGPAVFYGSSSETDRTGAVLDRRLADITAR